MAPAALGEVSVPRLWWSVTHSTQQPVPAHRDSERSAPLQCNCKGESSDRSMPAAEILLSTWENRNQSQSHLLPTGRASIRACAGTWKSPTCTALQSSQAHTSICNAQIGKSHVEGQGARLLCSEKNTEHKKYLFQKDLNWSQPDQSKCPSFVSRFFFFFLWKEETTLNSLKFCCMKNCFQKQEDVWQTQGADILQAFIQI